jgi:acyl-CoA synthetase (AMP-forming)/AMP-acid ligase II
VSTHEQQELLNRMRAAIRRHDDAVAVQEPAAAWTYGQFEALIGALRRALAATTPVAGGDDRPAPVGLLLDRSAMAYAAMWAAISLGRAYVPLNPRYPASRLSQIVAQAEVRA